MHKLLAQIDKNMKSIITIILLLQVSTLFAQNLIIKEANIQLTIPKEGWKELPSIKTDCCLGYSYSGPETKSKGGGVEFPKIIITVEKVKDINSFDIIDHVFTKSQQSFTKLKSIHTDYVQESAFEFQLVYFGEDFIKNTPVKTIRYALYALN